MKRILALILTLTFCIALTACSSKDDWYTYDISKIKGVEKVGTNEYVDENWGHFDDLHNISIMNSNFALPMMVSDLPEQFTLVTEGEEQKEYSGHIQQYCKLMLDDKFCGTVTVDYSKNKTLNDGMITSIVCYLLDFSEFTIGELTVYSTKEEVISVYGQATHTRKIEDTVTGYIYRIDKTCSITFFYDSNELPLGIQVISMKENEEARNNAQYISYAEPDKLNDLSDLGSDFENALKENS